MQLLPIVLALCAALLAARLSSVGPRVQGASFRIGTLPPQLPPDSRLHELTERMFKGEIVAPEHYAFSKDGGIYFGVADGRIMRTRADPVTGALAPLETVLYTGDPLLVDRDAPCGSEASEALCGRPLGMAFDEAGKLIVADAYLGLMEVDVHARIKRVLLREVEGTVVYFANSVVIGPVSGLIYFTDSTSRWRRRDFIYEVLESQPTGRLISFDRASDVARTLVHRVAFANGLLVDPLHERFIVLNELNRGRLLRLDLEKHGKEAPAIDAVEALRGTEELPARPTGARGPSPPAASAPLSGALSVLISNLPGVADNLAWEEDASTGRFWVGCGTARQQPFSLTDALSPWPAVRGALAWLLPKPLFLRMVPRVGLLLRLEVRGEGADSRAVILESMQDNTGGTQLLTGAYEHRGFLYLGAISHEIDYVGRVPWGAANRTDETHRIRTR